MGWVKQQMEYITSASQSINSENLIDMKINKITHEVAVSPQITVKDINTIKQYGFRSIICNRPDYEDDSQPLFADISDAAKNNGLVAEHLPVVSSTLYHPKNRQAFKRLINELPKPILAYCRSGTRCATLWSLSQLGDIAVDEILQLSRQAGYEVAITDPHQKKQ